KKSNYLVEGLASVVTRFFHSTGVVDLSCESSAAAMTSCLTLGIMGNSNAALGLAASSSMASPASRHSFVGATPADREDIASSPANPIADKSFASGLASCSAGD